MARMRVDNLLVQFNYFASREEAARAVLAGEVFYGDAAHRQVMKPGEQARPDTLFDVKSLKKYVSRGGEKIKGALRAFDYDMQGKNVIDAGSSTGGFSDCVLQEGARHVSAVDVGYGQLAWKLRVDPRVSVFERTNIRDVKAAEFGGPFDVAVADLSFIPLEKALPALIDVVAEGGDFILLVKPQFEAGQGEIGEKGVVTIKSTHERIVYDVMREFVASGQLLRDVTYSPIKGPEGNIEFWLYGSKVASDRAVDFAALEEKARAVVEEAYRVLS